jgi:class 3 adenylate cyclase
MPVEARELEAAGLWDPTAPGSAERLALLQWLADRGATLEQLRRAVRADRLLELVADLARGAAARFTPAELSARTGVPVERIDAVRFAAGLPPVGPHDAVLIEDDATVVTDFEAGEALFGSEPLRRFVQMQGTALARIAEAAVSLVLVHLEAPAHAAGAGELALAQARFRAVQSSRPLVAAMGKLFRAHLEVAARRARTAIAQGAGDIARMAVGFVDLVGFTTLARRLERAMLVQVIERFQETAHDVAALRGGRVVKFVGDEVMFVGSGAQTVDIALALIDRFASDPSVTPRGGVAHGDVLVRGGDYYGPVVNLAARLVEHAVPSEVLVTEPVAREVTDGTVRFEPAGRRVLKGFDEPVRVLTAARP